MKIRKRYLTPGLAALLCLALVPATRASDKADSAKAAPCHHMTQTGMSAPGSQRAVSDTNPNEGTPTRINKASDLLGMDVRNQNNQYLGHIKDIVLDWKTEQVSYAVINTAPKALLGIGGKLLAVPLTALTPGPDQKYLVLNADKATLKLAKGFSSDNWPSVGNPSWGAQPFWEEETAAPPQHIKPASQSVNQGALITDLGMR